MEIYLIRHTTPKIEKGVCYGFADLEVTGSYQNELAILIEKISQKLEIKSKQKIQKHDSTNKEKIELLIYTSPLKRCSVLSNDLKNNFQTHFQTNLQTYFDLQLIEDENLKEMNFGDWELKKWNEINETELKIWTDNFVTEFTPNGESFETLNERVISFWKNKIENKTKKGKNKIVFIVCHAGVIRSILCHVLQIPLQKAFSVSIDYGSISKLKVFETHTQVEFINL